MQYSTFNTKKNDQLLEPMFFGNSVNISRYDQQKHAAFEKLIEKQISFFWRPEEVDVSRDRNDFAKLSDAEKHIFMSNLKYQTLLDSVQGRSPNVAFLPLVSIPELETWIETWSFSETIHSRSYTHILRNVLNDPSAEFDSIVEHPEISKRAASVTHYYDELIECNTVYMNDGFGIHTLNGREIDATERTIKKKLYLAMVAVNVLEAIRFYVSFACTFAFAERNLMEGNAKIIKLVARDENLHKQGTEYTLNVFASGKDDPIMAEIALECREEVLAIFDAAVKQEKEWARYLFQDGSMIGLNEAILCQYIDFVADNALAGIRFPARYNNMGPNPLPWMSKHLNSDNVQVAPQETEISSYLVGQIDSSVDPDDFLDVEL
jgi:ribonucleoside-diphosphate reductase beta chain